LSAGVMRLSPAGGEMTPVTELDRARQETQHTVPVFLPDGRRFLYFRSSARADSAGLYVGSLDTPAAQQSSTRLIAATAGVAYVGNPRTGGGWILFQRQNVLLAQSVDSRLAIQDDPQLLADDVGSVGTYGR